MKVRDRHRAAAKQAVDAIARFHAAKPFSPEWHEAGADNHAAQRVLGQLTPRQAARLMGDAEEARTG